MRALGRSRQHLARILNAAFAEGLLSEQTHDYRLALLSGPPLIDQQELIGDLTLRTSALRLRDACASLSQTVASALRRRPPVPALLLSLDLVEHDRLLVGRGSGCDVVLQDQTVSRRHAQLALRDGTWTIRDLCSTNGTWVNGHRVGRMSLRPGDLLTLGGQSIQID